MDYRLKRSGSHYDFRSLLEFKTNKNAFAIRYTINLDTIFITWSKKDKKSFKQPKRNSHNIEEIIATSKDSNNVLFTNGVTKILPISIPKQ